ncbi:MAG: acylneuraminate cytidylyltransferase family protein [Lentisphaerae bacterium]|nr:acylneuraminate cytidylyltransferase family protein [Lentisphaerota bacterium]
MSSCNIQAWIFVRGDSMGLPGKNVKPLCGKPLIAYTIEAAKKCRFIKDIFVSTDSPTVAATAEQYGAIVPFLRPDALADIMMPIVHSWRHAIEWNRQQSEFPQMDIMVSLPVTTPLRKPQDITDAIELYLNGDCDSVVAVTASNRNPAYDMVYCNEAGYANLILPNDDPLARKRKTRPYDITNVVHVSSCDYIMQEDNYLRGRVKTFEVPRERSLDIRDIWDFKLAEIILQSQE